MKLGISLKDEIVGKIDQRTESLGISRSAFIAMAVTEKIRQDEMVDSIPEMLAMARKMAVNSGK